MNRPKCRACGKPLRKRTSSVEVPSGAPAPTEYLGQKVVQTLRRKPLTYRPVGSGEKPPDRVSFWCGDWGGYGDNLFCGLNCGYDWAIRNAK